MKKAMISDTILGGMNKKKEKYSPSLELAFRIAHYFKTPLEEVFSFQPEAEK
jgi:DNA-binding XRE family transcriptional regulator